MSSKTYEKYTGKDHSGWAKKFKLGGSVRLKKKRRQPCERCGTTCKLAFVPWLTQRWLCDICASRYLEIERAAKYAGVKMLPYVAPKMWRKKIKQKVYGVFEYESYEVALED